MTILITGSSGRLGKEVSQVFSEERLSCPSHASAPIESRLRLEEFFQKMEKDASPITDIIHLAAATGPPFCEFNRAIAWDVNVEGTRNLVKVAEAFHVNRFLYMSTPCVFRGDLPYPQYYIETDRPYAHNFYGMTKSFGEEIVRDSDKLNWLIVRGNFVPRAPWPFDHAFSDRWGTYLFADELAEAIHDVWGSSLSKKIVHLAGDKVLSMLELARLCSPTVQPLTLADYKGCPLTQNMSLKSSFWKNYRLNPVV